MAKRIAADRGLPIGTEIFSPTGYPVYEGDVAAIEAAEWPFEETAVEFEWPEVPIKYWSHSSLMSYLRNPLAWYKRYVEHIYDMPSGPAAIVGRAGHVALQHYYGGLAKEGAIDIGLKYLRDVPDFEINFGVAKTRKDKKKKRETMEHDYLQAVGFYLARPPKYDVIGVEVKATAKVDGLLLPIKAVSDLVVKSKVDSKALDIVDHKFVDSFSTHGRHKTLFIVQALFNYFTVQDMYKKPVRRFILHECKKRKNRDGGPQMRKYVIEYKKCAEQIEVFKRLINDATDEIAHRKVYLPNPSDMFEGENSFDIYRLRLVEK